MKNGVIFDIDGTLWNSTPVIVESWNKTLAGLHLPCRTLDEPFTLSLMGQTMEEWGRQVMPLASDSQREKALQLCQKAELEALSAEGGRLYPQLAQTLAVLHDTYHISILSNCGIGYIDSLISYAGLQPYIDAQLCYGQTLLDKADNIPYLMKQQGLAKAVYIGDTAKDQQACAKAGVPFIFASYGFGQADHPRWQISSLDQLPALVGPVIDSYYN